MGKIMKFTKEDKFIIHLTTKIVGKEHGAEYTMVFNIIREAFGYPPFDENTQFGDEAASSGLLKNKVKFTKVAYVAGPYSSGNGKTIDENIKVARDIALHLWESGIATICPHMNTANFRNNVLSNRDYIEGYLLIVERIDMVVLTPDWTRSKGAIREVAKAIEHDIPFYVYPDVPGIKGD